MTIAMNSRQRSGISLLEVLISIGVVAIGMFGVMSLVAAGKSLTAKTRVLTKAAATASQTKATCDEWWKNDSQWRQVNGNTPSSAQGLKAALKGVTLEVPIEGRSPFGLPNASGNGITPLDGDVGIFNGMTVMPEGGKGKGMILVVKGGNIGAPAKNNAWGSGYSPPKDIVVLRGSPFVIDPTGLFLEKAANQTSWHPSSTHMVSIPLESLANDCTDADNKGPLPTHNISIPRVTLNSNPAMSVPAMSYEEAMSAYAAPDNIEYGPLTAAKVPTNLFENGTRKRQGDFSAALLALPGIGGAPTLVQLIFHKRNARLKLEKDTQYPYRGPLGCIFEGRLYDSGSGDFFDAPSNGADEEHDFRGGLALKMVRRIKTDVVVVPTYYTDPAGQQTIYDSNIPYGEKRDYASKFLSPGRLLLVRHPLSQVWSVQRILSCTHELQARADASGGKENIWLTVMEPAVTGMQAVDAAYDAIAKEFRTHPAWVIAFDGLVQAQEFVPSSP